MVEWFNVTVGMDTGAHFSVVGDEILRGGYAYVGVSAQQVGIMGGKAAIAMAGMEDPVGLRGTDPERYGSLHHPGDAFSYDIFSQIGRTLRGPDSPLADLSPERFIAAGQSQSAFRMVTYVNAVHPDAAVFDGFYIHSRGRAAAQLHEGGEVVRGPLRPRRSHPHRRRHPGAHHRGRGRPGPVVQLRARPASPTTTTSGSGRWLARRMPIATPSAQPWPT